MIHIIEELHLNDFKEVRCARPRDLFARYGKRETPVSFDSNLDDVVPMGMTKLDSIDYLQKYDEIMSRQAGTEAQSNGYEGSNESDNNEQS